MSARRQTAKAAAFTLETFNRIVTCCAARVAIDLLSAQGVDQGQARRVAGELLNWAAALGDPAAHRELPHLILGAALPPPPVCFQPSPC